MYASINQCEDTTSVFEEQVELASCMTVVTNKIANAVYLLSSVPIDHVMVEFRD